jgi:hypothetical protein
MASSVSTTSHRRLSPVVRSRSRSSTADCRRANIYATDEHPSERALNLVVDRTAIGVGNLRSAIMPTNGDGMEIVVRRRA